MSAPPRGSRWRDALTLAILAALVAIGIYAVSAIPELLGWESWP